MPSGIKNGEIDNRNHYAFHWYYLSECTDEQMYWLGWIATDGCIHLEQSKYYVIKLCLNNKDNLIIKRFQKFIGAKNVTKGGINGLCTSIKSNIMAQRLFELGITERKSHTLVVHDDLADDAIFWRGAFEGDGCLSLNKNTNTWKINFCSASYDFLKQWCNFFNLPYTRIYERKKYSKNFNRKNILYDFCVHNKNDVLLILKKLYWEPAFDLRLERKWKLVDDALCELDTNYLINRFISPK